MSKPWPKVSLGELIHLERRPVKVEPEKLYQEIGIYCFGRGIFHKAPRTGFEVGDKDLFLMKEGDFIPQVTFAWEGAVAIVSAAEDGMYGSTRYPTFRVDESRCVPHFLLNYFKTEDGLQQLVKICPGSAGRNRVLSIRRIPEVLVPLPPLAEQRRVVARIEELAAQIHEARTLRHQAAEETEALVGARISALFDDEVCWKRVADAVSPHKGAVRSGPFGSQLLHEEFTQSGVAAIGTRDVQTNRFQLQGGWFVSPEKFEQFRRYRVFSGDVLCTIVGASIGRFCVVPENVPLAFTTKHIQALTLDSTKAEPSFVSLMLSFHRRCRESLFSQVEGSAQPSLNAGKILGTLLPLPPLSEQRRTVSELDALQAEVDALKRLQAETATELDALLPAMLDRAFKGEL